MYHIFYHIDQDGFGSGAIARLYFEEQCSVDPMKIKMHKINYGYDFPFGEISKRDTVVISDFSLPVEEMDRIAKFLEQEGDFIWIDHHKTAIERSYCSMVKGAKGIREIGRAAIELSWEYFFSGIDTPKAVNLLGCYDVWDTDRKGVDWEKEVLPFQKYMDNKSFDPKLFLSVWKKLFSNSRSKSSISLYKKEGEKILEAEKRANYKYLKSYGSSATFKTIDKSYKVIAVNIGLKGSMMFDGFVDGGTYDFMVLYVHSVHGWNFSLYSDKKGKNGGVDVSYIASLFGGGGHHNASGFTINNNHLDKVLTLENNLFDY